MLYDNRYVVNMRCKNVDGSFFSRFVAQCQRKNSLEPERSSGANCTCYARKRLMSFTVDLSEYADVNGIFRYIFIFVDSFSKFAFVFPSYRRDSESILEVLKKLFYSEGPWKIFHINN
ncbi:hypothetical protein CDIK_0492 [Cucumispora dikerogammari]|nr:hypothetical protein CDIK_0492 [Cucumispora dikerogammari]